MDTEQLIRTYVDELNEVVKSRDFVPFVQKWYEKDGALTFHHDMVGLESAKRLWTHLLPKGEQVPREVLQEIYKIEDGRVYTWRQLQGGLAPRPLYGMQETLFDDRTMIEEIIIRSVSVKPDLTADGDATESRLGRIFHEFVKVFNEFFVKGDTDIVTEWVTDDVRMVLASSFCNSEENPMAVVGPHHRIAQTVHYDFRDLEQTGDDRYRANVDFKDWGELSGTTPWDFVITPEGKLKEFHITLEI